MSLIDIIMIITTVSTNLAKPTPAFIPLDTIAKKNAPLTMIAEVLTSWSVALIKTSIALMLVRLQNARAWTRFLYSIIALQILTAVFVTILQCTRCIPTAAIWNPYVLDKWCWSPEVFKITMTVASSIVIITDVIFSLIPLTFLHHIRRSVPHRIVIGVLMSLGLLASAASVVKTIIIHRFDIGGDVSGTGISIALWASLEAIVGIIAACLPCLRGAFLRLLNRLGIYTEFANRVDEDSSNWPTTLSPNADEFKSEQSPGPFRKGVVRGDTGISDSHTSIEMVIIQDK